MNKQDFLETIEGLIVNQKNLMKNRSSLSIIIYSENIKALETVKELVK